MAASGKFFDNTIPQKKRINSVAGLKLYAPNAYGWERWQKDAAAWAQISLDKLTSSPMAEATEDLLKGYITRLIRSSLYLNHKDSDKRALVFNQSISMANHAWLIHSPDPKKIADMLCPNSKDDREVISIAVNVLIERMREIDCNEKKLPSLFQLNELSYYESILVPYYMHNAAESLQTGFTVKQIKDSMQGKIIKGCHVPVAPNEVIVGVLNILENIRLSNISETEFLFIMKDNIVKNIEYGAIKMVTYLLSHPDIETLHSHSVSHYHQTEEPDKIWIRSLEGSAMENGVDFYLIDMEAYRDSPLHDLTNLEFCYASACYFATLHERQLPRTDGPAKITPEAITALSPGIYELALTKKGIEGHDPDPAKPIKGKALARLNVPNLSHMRVHPNELEPPERDKESAIEDRIRQATEMFTAECNGVAGMKDDSWGAKV